MNPLRSFPKNLWQAWAPQGAPLLVASLLLAACAPIRALPDKGGAQQQVAETEQAFASTMALRNFQAFGTFLSAEAVFLAGDKTLRGKQQIMEGWQRYYQGQEAPFSWAPERVEVLDSGQLALSTGSVRDPKGKRIGTFTSIWRKEAGGQWHILFDKGDPASDKP
jgi:ketosteroid isomerase-like protein